MNKVAIKQIGFIEQYEVNDQWTPQQQQSDRGTHNTYLDGTKRFESIDPNAIISEKSIINESGKMFELNLQFVVRQEEDRKLARKYINRPLVIHVWTVDGEHYKIGTKTHPAILESDNRYDGLNTREMALSATYKTKTGILK